MSDFKFDIKEMMSQEGQDNAVKREIQKFVPEGLHAFETSASRDGTSQALGTFSLAATMMGIPQYNSGKDVLGFQDKVFSMATQAGLTAEGKDNRGHLPTTSNGVINPIDYLVPADIRMNTQRLLNAPWDGKNDPPSASDPPADPTPTPNPDSIPTPRPNPSPPSSPGGLGTDDPNTWDEQKIRDTLCSNPYFVMSSKNPPKPWFDHWNYVKNGQMKITLVRSLCLLYTKFILWHPQGLFSSNPSSEHWYGAAVDYEAVSRVESPQAIQSFGRDEKSQLLWDLYTFLASFSGSYRFDQIALTGGIYSATGHHNHGAGDTRIPHWNPDTFNKPNGYSPFFYDHHPGHIHVGHNYSGPRDNPRWTPNHW